MIEYKGLEYQIDVHIDGKYFARIHVPGVPGPSLYTDDYDTDQEAEEAARQIIDDHLTGTEVL